ncbi:MAG: LacI family transcriptional regulator [Bifidobacteriaceae bacterium]|jgi:LacI family transcriptional regulator|nr:LacI family transcriptional regulator [Bifidobacteriaceae bacterium]
MTRNSQQPTIYDVAARAEVSIGTVSKTLNSPAKVAARTRRRVLDAVRDLDFVPKEVAATRARRGARRIGVFAPFSAYASFAERLNGVLTTLPARRVEVAVFDVQSAAESSHVLESLPALRSLDGVIVMSSPIGPEVAAALRQGKLPAVLVDAAGFGLPSVTTDDESGGRLAAEVLVGRGRRRFAFLGHSQVQPDWASPSRRRLQGFAAALAAAGFDLAADGAVLVGRAFDEAVAAASALLSSGDRPDAVFAHSDELAAAVHLAARRLGLAVPEDLAIVGFDDSTIAQALDLTTIRQPLRQTGEWALRTLTAMIEDPAAAAPSVVLPVQLVRRGSA